MTTARIGKIKNCPDIKALVLAGKTEAEFKAACNMAKVAKEDIADCIERFKKAVEKKDKVVKPRNKTIPKAAAVELFINANKEHFGNIYQSVIDVIGKIKAIKVPSKSEQKKIEKALALIAKAGYVATKS